MIVTYQKIPAALSDYMFGSRGDFPAENLIELQLAPYPWCVSKLVKETIQELSFHNGCGDFVSFAGFTMLK